jgi:16S rRNA (guanine527-N7)-methyltransferase
VVAVCALEDPAEPEVTMVESDARKATFLRAALRETGARGNVIDERAEQVSPLNADVVSARALADLDALLELAQPHLAPHATCVFPKGRSWQRELEAAKTRWNFQHRVVKSKLDPDAAILIVKDLTRA